MLRTRLTDALKQAVRDKDQRTVSTLRLMLAALKDRDIAARSSGKSEGIDEAEIHEMLKKMAQQSREAAETYAKAGRDDLAQKERQEVAVIESFLPRQLGESETQEAVEAAIEEVGARSIKDMGRVMASLKQRYAGRMDFGRANALAKQRLGA